MIINVKKEKNKLRVHTNKGEIIIQFESEIWSFLKLDSAVVVLLKHCRCYGDQNIKKYNEDGQCVWTVEHPDPNVPPKPSAFTYLGQDNEGNLLGGSWNDYTYTIDINTGKFIKKVFTR